MRKDGSCRYMKEIHDLSVDDLCTVSREISKYTDIEHA